MFAIRSSWCNASLPTGRTGFTCRVQKPYVDAITHKMLDPEKAVACAMLAVTGSYLFFYVGVNCTNTVKMVTLVSTSSLVLTTVVPGHEHVQVGCMWTVFTLFIWWSMVLSFTIFKIAS